MRRGWLTFAVMAASTALVGTAIAQGMASVNIGVTVDGQDIEGKVTIKDQNGTVVAEGPAGTDLAVPVGNHKVIVEATALVDHPTYVHPSFPFSARNYSCKKAFAGATVTLLVSKGGRRINGDIVLQREGGGEPVAKIRSGQQVRISAGRYQGVFKQGRNEWEIKGLQFPEGAIQDIPVNF
jgi:hypothetical protein